MIPGSNNAAEAAQATSDLKVLAHVSDISSWLTTHVLKAYTQHYLLLQGPLLSGILRPPHVLLLLPLGPSKRGFGAVGFLSLLLLIHLRAH